VEYGLAAGIGVGVLLVFAGISAFMTGEGNIDERLARYAAQVGQDDAVV